MKFNYYFSSLLFFLINTAFASPYNLVITEPVVSLRVTPTLTLPDQEPDELKSKKIFGPSYEKFMQVLPAAYRDPDQNTQLLFNEQVRCLEKLPDGWLKVEALEQYEFDKNNKTWKHIIGYIKENQATEVKDFLSPDVVVRKPWATIEIDNGKRIPVPMGTKFHRTRTMRTHVRISLPNGQSGLVNHSDVYAISGNIKETEGALRSSIIKTASTLLGSPYCWGGRSPYTIDKNGKISTSCDCSGLINLVYRAHGLELPRNSRHMYMRAMPLQTGKDLRPGDLVFFAGAPSKKKINHVLMYLGNDTFLESLSMPGISLCKSQSRFGQELSTIKNGATIKTSWCSNCSNPSEFVIYFGTYLHDTYRLQHLREYARGNYNANTWVDTWQKTTKKSKKLLSQSTTKKSNKSPNSLTQKIV